MLIGEIRCEYIMLMAPSGKGGEVGSETHETRIGVLALLAVWRLTVSSVADKDKTNWAPILGQWRQFG